VGVAAIFRIFLLPTDENKVMANATQALSF
jgi:hypothetical protein